MTGLKMAINSIFHYWKINLASVLTTALCVAIITGALIIGDSIKYSLQQITLQRLGKTAFVLQSGEKLLRSELAADFADHLNISTAPVFQIEGMVSAQGGEKFANHVKIYGIDSSFQSMSGYDAKIDIINEDEILLNEKLAEQLGVRENDLVLIKIRKYDEVPLNSPFISSDRRFVSLYAKVKKVLSNSDFGRFSIRNDQVSPLNVFLNLDQLNELLGQVKKANMILMEDNGQIDIDILNDYLKKSWNSSDASFSIRKTDDKNQYEILSNQIFINENIYVAANKAYQNTELTFTYLVNGIEKGEKTTPYSFVSSLQNIDPGKDGIIINSWLSDDLNAKKGDSLLLKYYTVGPLRKLNEESKKFYVKDVVPFDGYAADESLMPNFPGLSDVDNCRDWNTEVDIDLKKIRDKDEEYWDDHRGTPKAFISYETAKEMWKNEFGIATSIRFGCQNCNIDSLEKSMLNYLSPNELGLSFIPVLKNGIESVDKSIDFSQLFIGMSFFIVLSSLLLIGMFFYLSNDYRNREMGLLRALGFNQKQIEKQFLIEGAVIILLGSLMGLVFAIGYNRLMLKAVNTIWTDMVKTNILFIKVYPTTLYIGWISGFICSFLTLYFTLHKKLKREIVLLQKSTISHFKEKNKQYGLILWTFRMGIVFLILTFVIQVLGLLSNSSSLFFIYGILMLISGLSGFNISLCKKEGADIVKQITLKDLSLSYLTRNRKRVMLIVSMLTIGVFLIVSTGANRQYMNIDQNDPSSGTGGFMYYAQTTLPIIDNLNLAESRYKYGLEKGEALGLNIIQFNTLEGDEASCFNLNYIANPRLLGVDYRILANTNSFSFATLPKDFQGDNPWKLLEKDMGKNTFPVIADQTVIQWSLLKKQGDTLFYQTEKGDTVNLILLAGLQNSIFQGNLLISDSVFRMLYPSVPGSKVMLVDGYEQQNQEIFDLLNNNLRDYGISLVSTGERLASFYSVQNTYLNVFVLLGGIGLIIGTLGIGILIFRSVLERQKELAVLRALGYNKKRMKKILITENAIILIAGIIIGSLAAITGTLPSFINKGSGVPVNLIFANIITLLIFGMAVVLTSVNLSLKKNPIDSLKKE